MRIGNRDGKAWVGSGKVVGNLPVYKTIKSLLPTASVRCRVNYNFRERNAYLWFKQPW